MKTIRNKFHESVQMFELPSGGSIFLLPLEAFPGFWAYVYLVILDDYIVLIDTGSGFGKSHEHLLDGLGIVRDSYGINVELKDIGYILLTHGHIDHFGGVSRLYEHISAKIGIHPLDKLNIENIDERLSITAYRLRKFFYQAGLDDNSVDTLMDIYKASKLGFESVPVDLVYESPQQKLGPFEIMHFPGHCAGQVAIRLENFVFLGDLILSHISPHQSPEQVVGFTGLGHYLSSLDLLLTWLNGDEIGLPGHQAVIYDIPARAKEIKHLHQLRLSQILEMVRGEPKNIAQIADELFGATEGYNRILAIEEAGAHVEYLLQQGELHVANWESLNGSRGEVPFLYKRY